MADISKIMLPNGTEYNIKDATARANQKLEIIYCSCNSAANASTKILQIKNPDVDDNIFEQYQQDTVILVVVFFTNNNTVASSDLEFQIGSEEIPYSVIGPVDGSNYPDIVAGGVAGQSNIYTFSYGRFVFDMTCINLKDSFYCYCDSSASSSRKVLQILDESVSISTIENFILTSLNPITIHVIFENTNTASNVSLSFHDSGGANSIPIRYETTTYGGNSPFICGKSGYIITYTIYPTGNSSSPAFASWMGINDDLDYRITSITNSNGQLTFTLADETSVSATLGDENVQADWSVTDSTSDAYIKNKPTIPIDDGFNARLKWDIEIPINANLNNYTTPGEYYFAGTSSSSNAVSNRPTDTYYGHAFRLTVDYFSYDSTKNMYLCRQIFRPSDVNNQKYYIRRQIYIPVGSGYYDWGEWKTYSNSDENFTLSLASTAWSSTTTTVNNIPYYTATVTASSLAKEYPTIYCGSSSTLPSRQEKDAFNLINYAIADTTNHTITFYAVIKPTINLTINVIG